MSLKSIWNLNIDETLVADELKSRFAKSNFEIFLPVNAQTKAIDLLFVRLKNYKVAAPQVKGSRTFTPSARELERFGEGSAAWFRIAKEAIFSPQNKVSFYIFVLHSFGDSEFKKTIRIDYLVVPAAELKKIAQMKKLRKGAVYHFFIWVDPSGKRAFDFNNPGREQILLSKYLNNWELLKK